MKKNPSLNLFFFLAFLVLASFSVPVQVALAADAPTATGVVSHSGGAEATTTCTFDVNVAASDDLIVVLVNIDNSGTLTVTDEDLQTYTEAVKGGDANHHSAIYTTTSPATNAANTVTVTAGTSGDITCWGITYSGANTTTPVGNTGSAAFTAIDTITYSTANDNSEIVHVCGQENTSTYLWDTGKTQQGIETNGGANKFSGAIATEPTTTAGSNNATCDPNKTEAASHAVAEIRGAPAPSYVVDLLDVYESASTTLDSGTAICTDIDLETASDCNGITTASFVDAKDVSGEVTTESDVEFSLDGSKMFVVDANGVSSEIVEYTCSTDFDVSTCTSASSPLDVSGQDTEPEGMVFSTNGLKLFVLGNTGDDINEYTCSTSYDVSSCSFVDAFSVSSETTSGTGLEISNSGDKFYLTSGTANIYQYDCSPNDISTCQYNSKFFGTGISSHVDIDYDRNGLRLYTAIGGASDTVRSYDCVIPWEIATCNNTAKTFDISSQENNVEGIFIAPDRKKIFVVGTAGSDVNEYDLNAPLKVGTSYRFEVEVDNTGDATGTPDQMDIFGVVGSPWDMSTSSFTNLLDISSEDLNPRGIDWSADGTKLFMTGVAGDDVNEYNCDPFDANSCSFVDATSISVQTDSPQSIRFSIDGTKMFIIGDSATTGEEVIEYSCSTAWDASTCTTVENQLDISGEETAARGMDWKPDGTKMYIAGDTGNDITEYYCSTPWDTTTCTAIDTFDVNTQQSVVTGVRFGNDGLKMYISGTNGDAVDEFSCTLAYDTSSCTATDSFAVDDGIEEDVYLSPDGFKLFVLNGGIDDEVNEYSIGGLFGGITATDITNSGCSTNTNWVDSISSESDIRLVDGTTCAISAASNAEFWFIVTPSGDARNDDTTFQITDQTISDTSTVTGFDITRPIFHFEELDVYESASTTLDSGTAICDGIEMTGRENCSGWTINTVTHVDATSTVTESETSEDIEWSGDGTKMYILQDDATQLEDVDEYACSTAFDTSTCTYTDNLDISGQEASPKGMAWNDDGTKFFVVGWGGNDINEYSCTAWDVSTCTFTDATSVNVNSSNPEGISFINDGLTVIIHDDDITTNELDQYGCTTAYDASTCTYASTNFVLDNGSSHDIKFSNDEKNFFITDTTDDTIRQYYCDFTNNYDISNCFYQRNLSVTTESTLPVGVTFDTYGNTMYVIDRSEDEVNEYDLNSLTEGNTYRFEVDIYNLGGITSSPDIFSMLSSVGGVNNINNLELLGIKNVNSEEGAPSGMTWNDDGTIMYVIGTGDNEVNEYSCDISYDPTVCSLTSATSISTNSNQPEAITFSNDGTKMFILHDDGATEEIDEYSCTAWDSSTCTYTDNLDVGSEDSSPNGMTWNDDGTKMFMGGTLTDDVFEYSCTAFDSSTCTFTDALDTSTQNSIVSGIIFSNDGTILFVSDQTDNEVSSYNCTTTWDVSTCSFDITKSIADTTNVHDVFISPNGSKFMVIDAVDKSVVLYDMDNVFGSITATGSSGCSTNTNWVDSIVNDIDVQQDAGTTCSLGLGESATYWFIVTLDTDAPSVDGANFKIDDGTTSNQSRLMNFSIKPAAGTTDYTKNISDNLSVIDAQDFHVLLTFSDPMSFTDSMAAFRAYTNTESDPLSFTDGITTSITRFDAESDPMSMTDSITTMVTYGNTESDPISFTDSLTTSAGRFNAESDPMSMTDSIVTTITRFNSESDPISLTDAITDTVARLDSESDPMSLTDSLTTLVTRFDSESDPISFTDSITTIVTIINTESDPISITDSITTIYGRTNTESDPMSITDSITTTVTYTNTESDPLSFTDSLTTIYGRTNAESDPISLTDSITTVITRFDSESDPMSLTDSITTITTRFDSESDPISLTDSITTITTRFNSESDPISFTDSITTIVTIINTESDPISLTDSVATVITRFDSESDPMSLTDSITDTVARLNTESDPMSMTDSMTPICTGCGDYTNTESDPISFTDSVVARITDVQSDPVSITDSITDTVTRLNTESDPISFTDSITATVIIINTESDPISLTDNVVSRIVDVQSDPISMTDSITAICTGCGAYVNTESDPMSITDSIATVTTRSDSESDPMSLTDTIVTMVTRLFTVSDPLSFTDAITAINSTGTKFINVTEAVWVADTGSAYEFEYVPTGKVIWFKVADPTNSTKGGIYQSMCDDYEVVTGVNGTGYLKCTLLHAPTATERGGVYSANCPAGEYVSGIDTNGDLVCSDPTP